MRACFDKVRLAGLDHDRVGPTVEHAAAGLGVGVAEAGERGVAQRRELGARADRAQHVAGPVRRRHLVGHAARELRRLQRQIEDAVGDIVVGEVGEVGPERVGLDGVRAGLEVGAMDVLDDVGARVVEDLVAPLETGEVVEGEISGLEHRAHGPVGDHHPLGESVQESRVERVRLHGVPLGWPAYRMSR